MTEPAEGWDSATGRMGRAALAEGVAARGQSWRAMGDLHDQISALLDSPVVDLGQIENTLTDGYAEALSLEAERWRLERRVVELSREIEHGDVAQSVRELSEIGKRLASTSGDLSELRSLLSQLRRHADHVRVGSPGE